MPPNYVVYKRKPDYWAKDLPIKRGFDNFDEIRVEYYRDANTHVRGLQEGALPDQSRGRPGAVEHGLRLSCRQGRPRRQGDLQDRNAEGDVGFVFNTRRPIFADPAVREALAKLFDFEWVNHNLYYGAYVRSGGYFKDSELSALGRPADEREKALLAPFPGVVAPDVMDGTYQPAVSDGCGADRKVLREVRRRAASGRLRARREQHAGQQGDRRSRSPSRSW